LPLRVQWDVGKTTLIKEICRQLGVKSEVTSPTFALVNEYFVENHGSVFHFDFYRLNDPTEALDFGLEDYLASGSFCLMEWPMKLGPFLPEESILVELAELEDKSRKVGLNL